MIEASDFLGQLQRGGPCFAAGVPCSHLTPLINAFINAEDHAYQPATSEGEAVGLNLGAYLAGRHTLTLCQNSGLGNCVNPMTSLNRPFDIPTLLWVTWRGEPGTQDEPQHAFMGGITQNLLQTLDIPCLPFPETAETIEPTLSEARQRIAQTRQPVALLMRSGTVQPVALKPPPASAKVQTRWLHETDHRAQTGDRPSRLEAIERLLEHLPAETAIIATTGKTGRELFTIADQPSNLYVVGGMGLASSIGLGVALNRPRRPVLVIDGDGAALMKLGALATIGAAQPPNLLHVILDNEAHDSTGGQATVSPTTRFAKVAEAANYRQVAEARDLQAFGSLVRTMRAQPGPSLIHLKIRPGSIERLGRPTLSPVQVKDRFMDFLGKAGP